MHAPAKSTDYHCHIFGPFDCFPMSPGRLPKYEDPHRALADPRAARFEAAPSSCLIKIEDRIYVRWLLAANPQGRRLIGSASGL
jgi:hypothetical protein